MSPSTASDPVYSAVWSDVLPIDRFVAPETATAADIGKVMQACFDCVRDRLRSGNLYDGDGKISGETLKDLGRVGYWGLLVDKQFEGRGASFPSFAKFLVRMATLEPSVAGLASVHSCLGAVNPLSSFGNAEQKHRYLPLLARGERLSAFALTEPGAGSDLTALRTSAVLDGDHYLVNGEKLFVTNAVPGSTIALVCLVDDKPSVLIADLPEEESEQFQVVKYGLHAIPRLHNNGLVFRNFPIPKANLLEPEHGNGLTIAYHGLNRGRVTLCANAAGRMRVMLASMLPWTRHRHTYGAAIDTRELVRRRIARMAALIVGCDALVEWCAWLLDQGCRGEMECAIAKIFGSEAQKEAAIELCMKTHGGRAFLQGHLFGDNVHDLLAPCVYEGEGEMLGMLFFRSLTRDHGNECFETNVDGWVPPHSPALPRALRGHVQFAADSLQRSRREINRLMSIHKQRLADRQCSVSELSDRIQAMVIMLVCCLYAAKQDDEVVHSAADVLCQDLKRRITGRRPSAAYFQTATKLGERIAAGAFEAITGMDEHEILMPYQNRE